MTTIEIWQPRYKDRVVLIAKFRVGEHNRIVFLKAKHMMDTDWYISGDEIRTFPLDTNGKIPCYAVPIDKLKPLEKEA